MTTEALRWKPIASAPTDGTDIIVGYDCAATWIVHSAFYRDVQREQIHDLGWDDDDTGWWSYTRGSVTQEQINPTHWLCETSAPDGQLGEKV